MGRKQEFFHSSHSVCNWRLIMEQLFIFLFLISSFSVYCYEEECLWRFKRNPQDCGSYFQCNFGKAILQYCPPGLEWNKKITACDWPTSSNCKSQPFIQNDITELEVEETEEKESCTTGQFQGDPTDCSKYFICDHGSLTPMSCGSSLHWNSQINACDWPANAQCGSGPPPPQPAPPAIVVGPPAPPESQGATTLKPEPEEPEPGPGPEEVVQPSTSSPQGPDPTIIGIITGPATSPGPPAGPPGDNALVEPFLPSIPVDDGAYKVICYFTGWSIYRPGEGKFGPDNIQEDLCTHYVYAFAVLGWDNTIRPADTWMDIDNRFYKRMTELKKKGKKVTIALGGWNDSGGQKYSIVLRDPTKVQALVTSIVSFVKEHNFDGIDLDYEYPGCPQGECKADYATDKNGFTSFVRLLREQLPPGSIISAAVSANRKIIDKGYNVRTISHYLDWIGVMSYDIHGSWEKETGHIAPLYAHPQDSLQYLNVNYSINYWIEKGAPPSKLILGIPFYGQSFTLANTSNNVLFAPARGGGNAGTYSRQRGILAYYEICSSEWGTRVDDTEGRMGPYLVQGDQWVSYDDMGFIKKKTEYVKSNGLGGAMIWALDFDDFNNKCGGGRYPLLNTIKNSLLP